MSDNRSTHTDEGLRFTALGGDERIQLRNFRLIVAGYTGRDQDAVEEHIRELAAIGVPPPDTVPAFFELEPALATQSPAIRASGPNTSGEVEPVLIRSGDRIFLGVGSDHTDRDIERESIAASKSACAKPISRTVVEVGGSLDWDAITLSSWADGRDYQRGSLSSLRIPADVLALFDAESETSDDLILFGGTVPVLGGEFVAGTDWRVSLVLPDGRQIDHAYSAEQAESGEKA